MSADDWTTAISVVGLACLTAGSWVVALDQWQKNRHLRELAALEAARSERYRSHLCRVATRAVCVDALWQERDLAIAELGERETREEDLATRCRALEVEVEDLRARASRGAA